MSGYAFDANIVIDALNGWQPAHTELSRARERWISRVAWIEVMSKVGEREWEATEIFMSQFDVDEMDAAVAARAAVLRNLKSSLKLPDAVILATAQMHGRILITRNTHDFPAGTLGVRVPYTL